MIHLFISFIMIFFLFNCNNRHGSKENSNLINYPEISFITNNLTNGTEKAIATTTDLLSAGASSSFAFGSNSILWSWGWGIYGQLGNGTSENSNIPTQIFNFSDIIQISGGKYHTVALKNDGTVWIWGGNWDGQLGIGEDAYFETNTPIQIPNLYNVVSISAGSNHTLVAKEDGSVWAWGNNYDGQLGNGSQNDSNVPVRVLFIKDVIKVAGGGTFSMALNNNGSLFAWGDNSQGQLGNNTYKSSKMPVKVKNIDNILSISLGNFHSLVLKNDGSIWTWGTNYYGNLGLGTSGGSVNVPTKISTLSNITSIATGANHSLAIQSNGSIVSWGFNNMGQLGDGTTEEKHSPTPIIIEVGITFLQLDGGDNHSIAINSLGTIYTWGDNTTGELGKNDFEGSTIPVGISNF